jgi:hypothetical protein
MSLTQLPQHFQTDFADNWEHLVQQGDSRLGSRVRRVTVNGKERTLSQIGTTDMTEITARNAATTASDTTLAKRWLRLKGYNHVTHIDEFDELSLGELSAPESEHVMAHSMGFNRKLDQVIIDAAEGTAYIGEDGTTTQAATKTVAVNFSGSNEGLTLAKILEAKRLMDESEVPEDGRCFAYSAQQLYDLLNSVDQIRSADYVNVKALVEGKVNHFAGFEFVRTELLTLVAATDVRTCLAFQRDGVACGIGQDKKVKISIRDDLNETIQIRTVANLGATRVEEERVVLVYSDESP